MPMIVSEINDSFRSSKIVALEGQGEVQLPRATLERCPRLRIADERHVTTAAKAV